MLNEPPFGLLRISIDHESGVAIEHCEQFLPSAFHKSGTSRGIDYGRLKVGFSPGG